MGCHWYLYICQDRMKVYSHFIDWTEPYHYTLRGSRGLSGHLWEDPVELESLVQICQP